SPFVKLTKTGGGGGQGASLHTMGVSGAGGMAGNFATPRICLSWWATFSSSSFSRDLRKRISAAVSSARAAPAWKVTRAINAIAAKAFFLSRNFIGFTPVMQTAGVQLGWQMWQSVDKIHRVYRVTNIPQLMWPKKHPPPAL